MNQLSVTAAMALATASIGLAQQPALAQRPIPIRAVEAPSAVSKEPVGSVNGLNELPGGRLLVNDLRRRRLIVLDPALASYVVTADTSGSGGSVYPRATGQSLYRYLGDSAVLLDGEAGALVVVEPTGKLGRIFAPVKASDLSSLRVSGFGVPGFDAKGRLVYRTFPPRRFEPPPGVRFVGPQPAKPATPATRDTMAIVRADFDLRTIDTLASVTTAHPPAPNTTTVFINPVLGALDDWALLSDGAIAVVRGQDYHIDWVYADGTRASTPKMAFDWRRLTDEDKQTKVDSARRIIDSLAAAGKRYGATYISRPNAGGKMVEDTLYPTVDFVPLKDIADYVPPIRLGALRPDRDGNLWILPTTSAQANAGLLYDVVNQKGEVFERVQLPKDRDIAGFGLGGVVYLSWRDGTNGFYIERTRVLRR